MTELEQARKLMELAPPLSEAEVEQVNALFPAYLFRRRKKREIWTSCCGRHEVIPTMCSDAEQAVLAAEHYAEPKPVPYHCHCGAMSAPPPKRPERVACPYCGREAAVKELGRTGRRDNLAAYKRVVLFRWYRGALWARAIYTSKKYGLEESLTSRPGYSFGKVYRFRPGKAEEAYGTWHGGPLAGMTTMTEPPAKLPLPIHEPFPCNSEYGVSYDVLGTAEVEKSPFRYCGFQAFAAKSNAIMRFLAVCTLYPRQTEMLMKAGLRQAVDDLAEGKKWNRRAFDWGETDPRKAFALDKRELRAFMDSGPDVERLAYYKQFRRAGVACSFSDLKDLAKIAARGKLPAIVSRLSRYRLTPARLMTYLRKENGRPGQKRATMQNLSTQWVDYVDAAVVLGYDLKNPVMLTPKELCAKHDSATKAAGPILEARLNAQSAKKCKERAKTLSVRYTFSTERWLIRPPVSAREIVAEGKALHHCVGGYADRHVNGSTTILFLRDRKRPGVPMVTIEMAGNCIVQIHGRSNDVYARTAPRKGYAELLDPWLEWLEKGSKRDKTGRPKLPKRKEAGAA